MEFVNKLRHRFGNGGDSDDEDNNNENNNNDVNIRHGVERKLHSRRPPNTAFRQQRLKSWQPVFNSLIIRLGLIIMGLIFIGVGIGLTIGHKKIKLIEIDYSECSTIGSNTEEFENIPNKWFKGIKECQWKYSNGECQLKFTSELKGKVYLYYKLTNFYQNHRKYVDSFDWNQLKGEAVPIDELNSKCGSIKKSIDNKPIYPCGLIANSIFNDTFSSLGNEIEWDSSDISWISDRKTFKPSKYSPDEISPPPNWIKRYPNGYTRESLDAVSNNQHLMVWMKTAALPKFYKLYGSTLKFTGEQIFLIGENYPILNFGGRKFLIFTGGSKFTGAFKNFGLAICFLICGCISTIFGIVFCLI